MNQARLTIGAALIFGSALISTPALAGGVTVGPTETYTTIQAGVDAAQPGDTVTVLPGTYHEVAVTGPAVHVTKGIRLKAKVKKGGPAVILEGVPGQSDGILVEPANPTDPDIDGFRIAGFTIQGFHNNGIHLRHCTNFRIEKNTIAHNAENGIFPTLSANGLVKRNVAYGSDDSALWVEASTNVRVSQNELYESPTGLEVTVSKDVFMDGNNVHDNTVGVGLYHPAAAGLGLQAFTPGNWVLTKNHIHDNNHALPPGVGGMVANIPPGGGVLVLGADDIVASGNLIENNNFYGISVIDYCLAVDGSSYNCTDSPPIYDSNPDRNNFSKNVLFQNGTMPVSHPLAPYAADMIYLNLALNHINRFCGNVSSSAAYTLTESHPFAPFSQCQ